MYYPRSGDCPCGSSKDYVNCCALYHKGLDYPRTAESLMRSRFSAFLVGSQSLSEDERYLMANYLLLTAISEDVPLKSTDHRCKQLMLVFSQQKWLSLRILSTGGDGHAELSFVTFVGFYHLPNQNDTDIPEQLHEISRFRKISGRWLYVDGDIRPPIKLRPNDACWCGSLKKYKKCHA